MPGVPAYAGGTPGAPVVGAEGQTRPARGRGVGRRGGRAAPHWGRAESRSGARCYDGRRAGSGKGCGCNYFSRDPTPGRRRSWFIRTRTGNPEDRGEAEPSQARSVGRSLLGGRGVPGHRVVGPILGFSRVRARMGPAAVDRYGPCRALTLIPLFAAGEVVRVPELLPDRQRQQESTRQESNR